MQNVNLKTVNYFQKLNSFHGGVSRFDREPETLLISVCVAPIYTKIGKKIDANTHFAAADAAIAA